MRSSACRSRLTTWVGAGSAARPSSSSTCRSTSAPTLACVPTAPEIEPTLTASRARARRSASRCSSASQPAALKPNVIGSAWMPWQRPTIGVSRCWIARRRTTSISRASSSDHDAGRVTQRRPRWPCRGRRSSSARSGASGPPARGRSVTERRKAMTSCCDSRSISRARSGSTSPTSRRMRSQSAVGHDARLGQRLDRQQLDPQPQLELVALPEDLAQLGQRVSIDHVPRVDAQLGLAGLLVAEGRARARPAHRRRGRGCGPRGERRSSRRRCRWRRSPPGPRAASGRRRRAHRLHRAIRRRAGSRSPAARSATRARPAGARPGRPRR